MKHLPILIADDDEDDRFLIKAAFEECGLRFHYFVQDGLELMQYLNNENAYADANVYKQPSVDSFGFEYA
jgi:CheY-like chemotaxis protein